MQYHVHGVMVSRACSRAEWFKVSASCNNTYKLPRIYLSK